MTHPRVVRNGEGEAYDAHWLFKQGSLVGGRFDFLVGSIPYLSGPPLHTHVEQDDTFYVLEGVLTVQVGEELYDLEPGDFATAPAGVPHTFDNIRADQPLPRACNLMTPGGLDQTFVELAQAGDDLDALVRVLEKHGVAIVGPTLGEKLELS
jgi:mannose-6-phosphate isomerase-like protein (cupin superfamily)